MLGDLALTTVLENANVKLHGEFRVDSSEFRVEGQLGQMLAIDR